MTKFSRLKSEGLLREPPFIFPKIVNFGPFPQDSPTSNDKLFDAAISVMKGDGLRNIFGLKNDGGVVGELLSGDIWQINKLYAKVSSLAENFDYYLYPSDEQWVACFSAFDLVLVIGMSEESYGEVLSRYGGRTRFWDDLRPALRDVSFNETFWERQSGPELTYEK